MGTLVPVRKRSATAISVAAHIVVLGALVYGGRHWVAPIVYPGTAKGHNLVLSYLPGRVSGAVGCGV